VANKLILAAAIICLLFILPACNETPQKGKTSIKIDSIIYKPGTEEPFNGTWKGEMDSMKIEFDVVNGKKEGNFRSYYPNGQLLMSGEMKNNRNVGEWKYFYDNGQVESVGLFNNDRADGKWTWYYPDGTLRQTGYFAAGQRDSVWKTYDSTGTLIDSTIVTPDSGFVTPY
jgi:antitoxin component YwqK of YwqJK toxin-antitoxin module